MTITTVNNADTTEMTKGTDVFGNILSSMRITGNLLLREDYSAPWAISIPNMDELAISLNINKGIQLAAFHLVQRGYIEIELENGNRSIVDTGEMVICFSGMAHILCQGASASAVPFKTIIAGSKNVFAPNKENYAQSTSLICGVFMLHNTFLNPLFEVLPALLKVSTGRGQESLFSTTAGVANLLINEINQQSFAHSYMIERYLELLCAEAIRLHLKITSEKETGWHHALKDPVVAQSIAMIHSQPNHHWSVKTLGQGVALSPSRFAARFTEIMGISPMLYVAKWRMYLAGKLLNDTQQSIEQIATQVGYENVAAFSRAFKRHVGSPPAAWRTYNRTL